MNNNLQQRFDEYVSELQFSVRLRPETIRGYKSVFLLFLKVMPEVTSIELLTPEMLNEFFKRIQTRQRIVGRDTIKTGVKKSTIKTQWSKLNVFFGWLEKKGYMEVNPLTNIKSPRVTYDDSRMLQNDEIHRIYSGIVQYSGNSLILRRDTMMVSLLLYTGVRRGEFISLQVRDIDMDKREITIRGETSKSKRTRVLKMHSILISHFRDYLKERNVRGYRTEYLIVSSRGDRGLSREGLKHWVNSLIVKSGVKFHLHRFRHTFASILANNDVGAFKILKMLGHTSISMTMGYIRSLRTEDMASDIERISIE